MRRVVVTGIGVVSPCRHRRRGDVGLARCRPQRHRDRSSTSTRPSYPTRFAGYCRRLRPLRRRSTRRKRAACRASSSSPSSPPTRPSPTPASSIDEDDADRVGVIVGSGIGGLQVDGGAAHDPARAGPRARQPVPRPDDDRRPRGRSHLDPLRRQGHQLRARSPRVRPATTRSARRARRSAEAPPTSSSPAASTPASRRLGSPASAPRGPSRPATTIRRGLASLRRGPRRLRDGRGRRRSSCSRSTEHARARGARVIRASSSATARRPTPTTSRHPHPTATAPSARCAMALEQAGPRTARHRLHQRPRHLDPGGRHRRDATPSRRSSAPTRRRCPRPSR